MVRGQPTSRPTGGLTNEPLYRVIDRFLDRIFQSILISTALKLSTQSGEATVGSNLQHDRRMGHPELSTDHVGYATLSGRPVVSRPNDGYYDRQLSLHYLRMSTYTLMNGTPWQRPSNAV